MEVINHARRTTFRVNAVAIDRQGIRCVTASDDRTVRVWSIADGRCEQVLEGHGGNDGKPSPCPVRPPSFSKVSPI